MNSSAAFHAGLDVGSTTLKIVITVPDGGEIIFSKYVRHNTDIQATLCNAFTEAREVIGSEARIGLCVTGSAGMGLSETYEIPFIQEVIAAAEVVSQRHPDIHTLVDIGGEDAKMIFFSPERPPDIRMNGSCAGGTGAFIDQVATLLGCEVSELDALAKQSRTLHPIASRCGVFAKTDIQNLLARNIPPADIAASVFHAVAIQIVTTLARGQEIKPKLLLCGGPLAFIPSLREACRETMGIAEADCAIPENAALIPAIGCALAKDHERLTLTIDELLEKLSSTRKVQHIANGQRLPLLFTSAEEYEGWKKQKQRHALPSLTLSQHKAPHCYLGIDSGSTTTKIVAIDDEERVLFTHYQKNEGNPLGAVCKGLTRFLDEAIAAGHSDLRIAATTVTGYGEDLVKAAFDFESGLVETIAHYLAAQKLTPDVSFILDIGGQDMKAAFIENGTIVRLDINEACSSGCGSFIEGFANSLGHSAAEFSQIACTSQSPCDLGTRCTVFMNSKVKQSLREGSTLPDIASGLAYSVIKNCLFKVLKLRGSDALGKHIVVQGGTMRNHAVVRALEQLTEREVLFSNAPELMGAYGAALNSLRTAPIIECRNHALASLTSPAKADTEDVTCPGCENRCNIRKYTFANANTFFSGNKCEKIYTNRGSSARKGDNIYTYKASKLFNRAGQEIANKTAKPALTIGIPRILNFYENYPFWFTLLTESGMKVQLSAKSTFELYEKGAATIMSDNICFPAKLAHGHIYDLIAKKVDRIFLPFVVHEQREDCPSSNSFNCPIVTGYSDVIRSAIDPLGKHGIPLDSPNVTFRDDVLLKRACRQYMVKTLGVPESTFTAAFTAALRAQEEHRRILLEKARTIAAKANEEQRLLIVLAGRPYHADPLIQHKVSDMISALGIDVVSEEIVREETINGDKGNIRHWAYPNRILNAARWVADAPAHIHFVQLTSFGCGPDAFIVDEATDILRSAGKPHTVLKIDDINNLGSLKLRIRSLVESLEYRRKSAAAEIMKMDVENNRSAESGLPLTTPPFTEADNHRTLLAPFFSETYSPFIPALLGLMGYRVITLPPPSAAAIDYGLQYANNEVCYPATLVVGNIIDALKSGKYKHDEIAIGITQTGGQCRASSYISLIKKAMLTAGYSDIPVISIGTSSGGVNNDQPGFKLQWRNAIRPTIGAILYADRIGQMFNATAPRELLAGSAAKLRDDYISSGAACVARSDVRTLYTLLEQATVDFAGLIDPAKKQVPRIGVVGEIYVKYNSIGHKNVVDWLIKQGVEPVVPPIADFFLQDFPNRRTNIAENLAHRAGIPFADSIIYYIINRYIKKFDRIAEKFPYYHASHNIYEEAKSASRIINIASQYGEGWLIPAEIASFAERGIHNAVSLQPFGCIANHLVAKGIEKRIRDLYPSMNLLFLDLDSGTSEANLLNRLHFMVQNARSDVANNTTLMGT